MVFSAGPGKDFPNWGSSPTAVLAQLQKLNPVDQGRENHRVEMVDLTLVLANCTSLSLLHEALCGSAPQGSGPGLEFEVGMHACMHAMS